jgi:glutathione synthase
MSAEQSHPRLVLVFVADPVATFNPAHDTTVALMESAQARGHRVLVTTMAELEVRNGRVVTTCTPLVIRPAVLRDGHWYATPDWASAGARERWALDDADAVFIRTDPPVDAGYLRGTYVLDLVDQRRTLLINNPAGLRSANEKLFALRWPELCPATLVTASISEILETTRAWGSAVIKPTDGMAGRGIMLLRSDDENLRSIVEASTAQGRDQVVVQRFIEGATEGDRRVIVLDGTPVGAVRRVAAGGDFRCNMAAGAEVVADSVSARDRQICEALADSLAELGLILVGIDVIGEKLTEVNVTSPTGLREIDALSGTSLSDTVLAWVETRVQHLRASTCTPVSAQPRAPAAERPPIGRHLSALPP